MSSVPFPKWEPKDKTSPLKEEYALFYQEAVVYRAHAGGAIEVLAPTIASQLTSMPAALDTFTDKMKTVISATDLTAYLYEVRTLYDKAITRRNEREASTTTTSSSAHADRGGSLKVALPALFDGTTAKARTFLTECNNYIALNEHRFPSDRVKIQWALQLCTDKAANWKRIQLELACDDDEFEPPEHLRRWEAFQAEFRLKWDDLHLKQKARQRFFNGVRQTGSVRRYAEHFEEVILEAEFRDADMITAAFYHGLKTEVKNDLIGKQPTNLVDLKAMAIRLDEERTVNQEPDRRNLKSKPTRTSTEPIASTATPYSNATS